MGDIKEGNPKFVLESDQFVLHLLPQFKIQRPKRLVEQKHTRLVDDRSGNGDTLLLPAGKRVHRTLFVAAEIDQLQRIFDFIIDIILALFTDLEPESDIVSDIHMRKQRIFLEYGIDLPLVWGQMGDILPLKQHLTGIRRFKAAQNSECRCLAAAGRTEQRDKLVFFDLEVKLIEHQLSVVRF